MGQAYSAIQKRLGGEEEQFPTELEGFGYHFNENGEMRNIENGSPFEFTVRKGDPVYNQKHYNALGEVLNEEVYKTLERKYKLQRTFMPINAAKDEPKSFIFISGDLYTNTDKLLILIHGNGVVRAGQWARRLIINDNLDNGTQFPYIKWARENGYAVVVANPNLNEGLVERRKKLENVPIRGNSSPEEHAESLWKEFVQRAPAKHVAIVAHSYGGVSTLELTKKYLREFEERVFAVALTDSVHGLKKQEAETDVVKFYKEKVVNWASAYDELDTQLQTMDDDVPTVSAGTDKHEMTSYTSMASIFKYFDERYKELKDPSRRHWIVGEGKLPKPRSVNTDPADVKQSTDVNTGAEQSTAVDASTKQSTDVNTSAGQSTDVNTSAGQSTDVEASAKQSTDVNTSAGQSTDVNTSAEQSTDVEASAKQSTDVNTSAGQSTDVNTSAEQSTDVEASAEQSTDVEASAKQSTDADSSAEKTKIIEKNMGDDGESCEGEGTGEVMASTKSETDNGQKDAGRNEL